MVAQRVDAVWIWVYSTTAQKATYGRFNEDGETGGFSKDYLQVSGDNGTLIETLFPLDPVTGQHALLLHSPGGIAQRGFISHSVDRAHLAWDINRPPDAWRMAKNPTIAGPGTIPGNPSRTNFTDALKELAIYDASGITSYLVAVKLADNDVDLHLRVYVRNEPTDLTFADISHLPSPVGAMLSAFTGNRACASARFARSEDLYFDPVRNHEAWTVGTPPMPTTPAATDDAAAETLDVDDAAVAQLEGQLEAGHYEAPDQIGTTKTRGSGQKVFADRVKKNYGYHCALTGISSVEFLVASHIVPWVKDKTIRLDPANGVCLSTLIDRAFDTGFLTIDVEGVAHVNQAKVGTDEELRAALAGVDGKRIAMPKDSPPKTIYLRRRLAGFDATSGDH